MTEFSVAWLYLRTRLTYYPPHYTQLLYVENAGGDNILLQVISDIQKLSFLSKVKYHMYLYLIVMKAGNVARIS